MIFTIMNTFLIWCQLSAFEPNWWCCAVKRRWGRPRIGYLGSRASNQTSPETSLSIFHTHLINTNPTPAATKASWSVPSTHTLSVAPLLQSDIKKRSPIWSFPVSVQASINLKISRSENNIHSKTPLFCNIQDVDKDLGKKHVFSCEVLSGVHSVLHQWRCLINHSMAIERYSCRKSLLCFVIEDAKLGNGEQGLINMLSFVKWGVCPLIVVFVDGIDDCSKQLPLCLLSYENAC